MDIRREEESAIKGKRNQKNLLKIGISRFTKQMKVRIDRDLGVWIRKSRVGLETKEVTISSQVRDQVLIGGEEVLYS